MASASTTPLFLSTPEPGPKNNITLRKAPSSFALLICDSGAGWSRQVDNFKALEAYFATPFFKIRGRVIECFAELDEHVERHEQAEDIVAARVIDQGFDDNDAPPGCSAS